MKVFLDDVREPPQEEGPWVIVRSAKEAVKVLKTGKVTFLSFDHDLGGFFDGGTVAKWIEKAAYEGRIPPLDWQIHSANPVGGKRIFHAMGAAEKFWAKAKV